MELTRVRPYLAILGCAAAGLTVHAQETAPRISGPALGVVFDAASANLRPILGIPGSASLGGVLRPGERYRVASVAASQKYALAVSDDDGTIRIVDLRDTARWFPAPGDALTGSDLIAISPDSGSAALYRQSDFRLQILTGLPDAASVAVTWSAPDGFQKVTALAVSNDALTLLANDTVTAVQPDGASRQISSGPAAGMVFLGGTKDAAILDAGNRSVYLVRDVAGLAARADVLSERDGLVQPSAIGYAADRGLLLIADQSAAAVATYDLRRNAASLIPCSGSPSRMTPLGGAAAFLLSEAGAAPALVLDALAPDPRAFFVLPPPE